MWRLKALIPNQSGSLEGKTIEVGSARLQVHKTIAQGGFSFVYLVKDASNGRMYALKHIIINDRETQELVRKEIQTMLLLKGHPNVVCLHAHAIQDTGRNKECYLLLDYCDKMLVHAMDHLGNKGTNFDERQLLLVFRDVCNAVYAMHTVNPPIAHRDLKAENVLLASDGNWRLCDFGSCSTTHKRFDKPEEMSIEEDVIRKHTTPAYRAPEMWDLYRREYICEKVDIWALGCLLYRMAYFKSAFDGESKLQILNGNYRIPESPKYSANLMALLKDMLAMDQSKRPDIAVAWRRVNDMLPPDVRKQRPDKAPGAPQQPPPQRTSYTAQEGAQPVQPSRAPPSPPNSYRSTPPPPVQTASSDTGSFWAKFGDETPQEQPPRQPEPEQGRLSGSPPSSPPRKSSHSEEGGSLHKASASAKAVTGALLKKTGAADLFNKIKDKAHSVTADSDTVTYQKADEGGLLEDPDRPPTPPPPSYTSVAPSPRLVDPSFQAFAAEFNNGGTIKPPPSPQGSAVPRHSRGPSGDGGSEIEKVKEELKRVTGEKAELAERCHKLEVVVRSQQAQIAELQAQVVNSPITGVVSKSRSNEPAGWQSFSNTSAGGSFWEAQEHRTSTTTTNTPSPLSPTPPTRTPTPPPFTEPGFTAPPTGSWQSFDDPAGSGMGSRKDSRNSFAGDSTSHTSPGHPGVGLQTPPMQSPGHSGRASPLWDPPASAEWQARKGAGQGQQNKASTLDPFSALSQLKI